MTSAEKMVELWGIHTALTRLVVIGKFQRLAETDATAARLLMNQDDLGAMFLPKFGPKVAKLVRGLLRVHIEQAGGILDAIRDGQMNLVEPRLAEWHANGRQIADSLTSLPSNPFPKEVWRHHMREHLDILTRQILSYRDARHEESLMWFLRGTAQAANMGLAMSKLLL